MPVDKTLLYLHIPKAAGGSVESYFQALFPPEQVADTVYLLEHDRVPSCIRFACSHFWYGIHERCDGPFEYITFLRHPVDRLLSAYFFMRRMPSYHGVYIKPGMTLLEFARSRFGFALDNLQTRMLVPELACKGVNNHMVEAWRMCGKDLPVTEAHFQQACDTLRSFAVVGLVERFNDSMNYLRHRYNLPPVEHTPNTRKTKDRPPLQDLSLSISGELDALNSFDLRLYDFAQTLFEQQLSDTRSGTNN